MPDELRFRSFPSGEKSLRIDQIKQIHLMFDLPSNGVQPMVRYRLVITPLPHLGLHPMAINPKLFSSTAIQSVLSINHPGIEVKGAELKDGLVAALIRGITKQHKK